MGNCKSEKKTMEQKLRPGGFEEINYSLVATES